MPTPSLRRLQRALKLSVVFAALTAIVVFAIPDTDHPPERIATTAVSATTSPRYTGPVVDQHRQLVDAIEQAQLAAFYEWAAAQPPPTAPATKSTKSTNRPTAYGTGACGGDLPPCWVMMRESGGDINAYNPTGCNGRGCYGKWQCDPRTCSGTGTEEEQDAEARALWNGGRGCSHWAACG